MTLDLRGAPRGALCCVLLISMSPLISGAVAAADAASPVVPRRSLSGVQSVPPPSAEADADTYARCMKLARQDPRAAQDLAEGWRRRGGAHPADHCAAVALIGLGKYKEAAARLQALAQAMAAAPAGLRADVLDQEGQAWLLAGDPVRAYAAAGEATALAPGDPELLIDRAEAAAAAGYLERAVADLDRVLKSDPNRVEALVYRASAYRALDRLDPARADIDKALAEAPHSAAALLERGNIRRLEGDRDGARRDWEEVGHLAPGSPADMAARANIEHLAQAPTAAPAMAIGKAPAP
ncbi:MAG TPA: tetratricopeptide repeat protein [Stellaceae bacterium]|nr:tetratricopeptide repeat protein [Stellaceae bacterium]